MTKFVIISILILFVLKLYPPIDFSMQGRKLYRSITIGDLVYNIPGSLKVRLYFPNSVKLFM